MSGVRAWILLVPATICVVAESGCSSQHAVRSTTSISLATVPPTTTALATTVPATTTTVLRNAPAVIVPDAAAVGQTQQALAPAEQVLTEANLLFQIVPTTSSACYYTTPTGQQAWNAGEVIGQSPSPGTVVAVGSTIDLQVCSGTPSIVP